MGQTDFLRGVTFLMIWDLEELKLYLSSQQRYFLTILNKTCLNYLLSKVFFVISTLYEELLQIGGTVRKSRRGENVRPRLKLPKYGA